MAGKFDVYSFGISGAGLSEFLQISRYVRKYFDPEILVINVVDNDFDESLDPTKAGQLYVKIINGQAVEAPIIPFCAPAAKAGCQKSAKNFFTYS